MRQNRKRSFSLTIITLSILVFTYFAYAAVLKAVLFEKAQNSVEAAESDIADMEEYLVYSALMERLDPDPATELILIENQTGMGLLGLETPPPGALAVSDALWSDFTIKNQSRHAVGNELTLTRRYLLFDHSDLFQINRDIQLTRTKATPFHAISRVGFDVEKNTALVHVSVYMPGRLPSQTIFAFGQYYLLRKIDGRWIIESQQQTFTT